MKNTDWYQPLLNWYRTHQRELSWRTTPSPYRTWISEIMLQQTQVETVKPYFERFMQQFPDVFVLAAAKEETLLRCWEGLGYYSRAKNIHKTAKEIAENRNGVFPTCYAEWLKLTGIGTYTAAAIASIAFGEAVPVVDGNVLRVYARLFEMQLNIQTASAKNTVFEGLTPVIAASGSPSEFNQAMMELGALICRPKSPDCPNCPLQKHCQSFHNGTVDLYPITEKKAPIPHRLSLVLLFECEGKLYFKRRDERLWHGLWTFPLLPLESADIAEIMVLQAFRSESGGQTIRNLQQLKTVRHTFTHFTLELIPWIGEIKKTFGDGRWLPLSERDALPLPVPIRKILLQKG